MPTSGRKATLAFSRRTCCTAWHHTTSISTRDSNSSTWSLLHHQKTIMFLALLHGEVFPAFTTDLFTWQPHAWRRSLTWRGLFLSLLRKECFCSFQTLLVLLLTFTEVACFLTEKNYDVASLQQEFCTGSIIPSLPRLEHGDDGWSCPPLFDED
jgi:hypothetical protein